MSIGDRHSDEHDGGVTRAGRGGTSGVAVTPDGALAYCYWQWVLLAREQRDRNTEREKLAASVLSPEQRDSIQPVFCSYPENG